MVDTVGTPLAAAIRRSYFDRVPVSLFPVGMTLIVSLRSLAVRPRAPSSVGAGLIQINAWKGLVENSETPWSIRPVAFRTPVTTGGDSGSFQWQGQETCRSACE